MKRQEEYRFSQVPVATIPRSVFNRNFQHKTTFDEGAIVPVLVDEVLPGDTYRVNMSVFCRLATPIAPLMDNLHLDVHFFYVPNRLVWNNWEKFCGAQDNPGDSTSFVVPTITGVVSSGSLGDYMGLPVHASGQTFSALPFRAYNRIYNEWYRDQNLISSQAMRLTDGPDSLSDYEVMWRAKRHDYFTGCLPWPQKGPGVMLPLGSSATVKTSDSQLVTGAATPMRMRKSLDGGGPQTDKALFLNTGSYNMATAPGWTGSVTSAENLHPVNLYADLSTATAATINSLRQAFQVQHLLERDARGGTRYVELLKSHFGVVSPDFRLQRTEYLGGGSVPVIITPVPQTSNSPASGGTTTPQGTVAAYGTAAGGGIGFSKSFTEHGFIIGLVSTRADLTYFQGQDRMWFRSTRYDFYWPALAHLGEQAVLKKELFWQGSAVDTEAFGYQERWAEYRYKPSKVTGLFRPGVTGNIAFWHLAQYFAAMPPLAESFITESAPMARVRAISTGPDFLFDSYFKMKVARPMPLYSVPGLIDHF